MGRKSDLPPKRAEDQTRYQKNSQLRAPPGHAEGGSAGCKPHPRSSSAQARTPRLPTEVLGARKVLSPRLPEAPHCLPSMLICTGPSAFVPGSPDYNL